MATKQFIPNPDIHTPPVVSLVSQQTSAAGLTPIRQLLTHLPAQTGFVFLYLQPDGSIETHQTATVLSGSTSMPVQVAQAGQRVHPDTVYIIPAGETPEIIDGVLTLRPSQPSPTAVASGFERTESTLPRIEDAIRAQNERLRDTSHDLRSHFGVILGTANMLEMAQSDSDRARLITMMQRNLQQATQLLTELLELTQPG